ncbi:MAG: polyketide cyclase, partial [Bacteroidota bacterium]|nr:polyketide cyclase [Bacteroidota bacterium]
MSILLTILGIVFAVLVLVLIVAAFLRKDYAVTKEVVINRPVKEVFEYIRFVKNQDEYSVWNK